MQEITLGDSKVEIACNAFTPIAFSQSFSATRADGTHRPRDISDDIAQIVDSLTHNGFPAITPLLEVFYAMAKTADPKLEPFEQWLGAFPAGAFDLTDGEGWAAQVMKVIQDNFFPGAKEVASEAAEASAAATA